MTPHNSYVHGHWRIVEELLSVSRWFKDAQKLFALDAHVDHISRQ